jgi:hypothetical protein
MDLSASMHDLVAATLTELGVIAPSPMIQTILMHDGYFVGHKLRYDGGHAIWLADGRTIEFYDENGELLKTLVFDAGRGAAA